MCLTIFQDGVLCAWSAVLELQKATDIASCQSTAELNQSSKLKKMTVWVTDTAMLTSCNILVLATTSRELLFFDVSSNVYACQYKLRGESLSTSVKNSTINSAYRCQYCLD